MYEQIYNLICMFFNCDEVSKIIISFLSKMSISYIEKITNFFTKYVSTDGGETLKDKKQHHFINLPQKKL